MTTPPLATPPPHDHAPPGAAGSGRHGGRTGLYLFMDRGAGGAQKAGLPKPKRCWAARSSCSRAAGRRPSCGKEGGTPAGFWAQKGRFWVNGALAGREGTARCSVPCPEPAPAPPHTHLDGVLVALLCLQLPPSLEKHNRGLWGGYGGTGKQRALPCPGRELSKKHAAPGHALSGRGQAARLGAALAIRSDLP